MSGLLWQAAFRRRRGTDREELQDAAGVRRLKGGVLCALADGMGRYEGGRLASTTAVKTVIRGVSEGALSLSADARFDALHSVTGAAHDRLAVLSREAPDVRDMGTTLVAALLGPDDVVFGHVGDSRLYVLRGGAILARTTDHSVVQGLIDLGRITAAEARTHPMRSTLLSSLGGSRAFEDVTVTYGSVADVQAGDVVLLSSDGLHGALDDETIAMLACRAGSPRVRAERLLRAALRAGSTDDVAVLVAVARSGP